MAYASHSSERRESTPNTGALSGGDMIHSAFFRRTRQSTSNLRLGSNSSLSTLTGSTTNLLDQTRLLSMQEDAHCRRITVEVMKRCLYKSVVPCRRRAMNRLSSISMSSSTNGSTMPSRLTVSVPVTPIRSKATSPALSPTGSCHFFNAMSELSDVADAENQDRGLSSLFRPRPRYIRASCSNLDNLEPDMLDDIAVSKVRDSELLAAARRY